MHPTPLASAVNGKAVPPDEDYLYFDQVAATLGATTARLLARHADLVALDGEPCWAAGALADVIGLLDMEGRRR